MSSSGSLLPTRIRESPELGSHGSANPTPGPAQVNPNPTSQPCPSGKRNDARPKNGSFHFQLIPAHPQRASPGGKCHWRPWNAPENPGWWDQWKMHWRGTQHRKVGTTGKTQGGSKEKLGCRGERSSRFLPRTSACLKFQVGIQALLRNSVWKGSGFAAQSQRKTWLSKSCSVV